MTNRVETLDTSRESVRGFVDLGFVLLDDLNPKSIILNYLKETASSKLMVRKVRETDISGRVLVDKRLNRLLETFFKTPEYKILEYMDSGITIDPDHWDSQYKLERDVDENVLDQLLRNSRFDHEEQSRIILTIWETTTSKYKEQIKENRDRGSRRRGTKKGLHYQIEAAISRELANYAEGKIDELKEMGVTEKLSPGELKKMTIESFVISYAIGPALKRP